MNGSDQSRHARFAGWLSPSLAALTMLLSGMAMLGWLFGFTTLTTPYPGLIPMKFNTALLLFAIGGGIGCATVPARLGTRCMSVSKICAGIVFVLALVTLAEYLTGQDLGIDELLVREPGAPAGEIPGRMSWVTAVTFILCGTVLFLLAQDAIRHGPAIHAGAVLIILIAMAMFLRYVYNIEEMHRERLQSTPMALNTTLAFAMAGIAILTAHPRYPLRRMLSDEGAAGRTTRMLIPVAVLLPLLGGSVSMTLHERGLFGPEFAISSFSAAVIVGFGSIVLWTALQLDRVETTREQAEHELQAASKYARSLLEASLDPLVTISAEGKITDVNRATEEVVGRKRVELIGSDFADYFTEPLKARAGYERVLREGELRDYPVTVRHRTGRTEDVLYNATTYRDDAGNMQGVLASARVITALKRAEEVRARLAAIVESTGDAIIGIDLDGFIRSWNAGAEKLYGYTAPEVINTPTWLLAPPGKQDEVRGLIAQAKAGHMIINREAVRLNKDGRLMHVALTLSPVRDDQGGISGLSVIARDISEKKRWEEELEQHKNHLEEEVAARTAELKAANQELESFAYSVSHDLRVPLRAIDGFSRMVVDEYADKLDDEGKRLLGVVSDNVRRMGQLIDDILALSRMGRTQMNVAAVDMKTLAQEVVEELRPATEGREVRIGIGDLPTAAGDRNLLRQVFINLLANAIKFTRTRPVATIDVRGSVEGGECHYLVQDNGVGFEMQYVDKLFGVFQRLHSVEEFEGTGIGLAIVRRIVTRHGGRAWAEAEVDHGATFHFALPTREENHDERNG